MPQPTPKDKFMYKLIMDWLIEIHDKKYPDKNDSSSSGKRIFMLLEVLVTEILFGRNKKINDETFIKKMPMILEKMLKDGFKSKKEFDKEFDKKRIDGPVFIDKTHIV